MVPKIIYEMAVLVIFISLFRRFNMLSKDYQAEQRGHGQSRFVTVAKILCGFVCTLYFLNTLLFNVISPLFLYLDT